MINSDNISSIARYPRILLLGCASVVLPSLLSSQVLQVQTNEMFQLTLRSDSIYSNPHKELGLDCEFTGPNGQSTKVAGFWDGERTYRVRFAFPDEGEWFYQTTCSDVRNTGLHGLRGRINVRKCTASNPLPAKGRLKISDDRRYLVYSNGDSFFYLGDTAWEITWKSRREEVLEYLADRKKKGFTVIQIVVMSHQRLEEFGVINRDGEPFFLNHDYSMLNPRYFDHLDWIVKTANDSGIVVAMAPLWAAMNELHFDPKHQRFTLSREQSLLIARYVGARYAGSNVIWIVAGDASYDTRQRKEFWSEFARTLRAASGHRHLMTIHPSGWTASFDYFDGSAEWIDFHMYQSSHVAGGDFTWKAGSRGYQLAPRKPVLNGEACYEDIYNMFWVGNTGHNPPFRLRPEHVRQASYESILSGALVGMTYGADGIWQWHKLDLPGFEDSQYTYDQALNLPGSQQMSILKNWMVQWKWYNFVPRPNLLLASDSKYAIQIASNEKYVVAYLPYETRWVSILNLVGHGGKYRWLDPSTGETYSEFLVDEAQVEMKFFPPNGRDWVLLGIKSPRVDTSKVRFEKLPSDVLLYQNYPNPFNSYTRIAYSLPVTTHVCLRVYDLLGRVVATLVDKVQTASTYLVRFDGSTLSSGVYFYRIETEGYVNMKRMVLIK